MSGGRGTPASAWDMPDGVVPMAWVAEEVAAELKRARWFRLSGARRPGSTSTDAREAE